MSNLIIQVARVDDVKPHPNADRLDLLTVLGWQVVEKKNRFSVGDKVVYFPLDTVIAADLAEKLGVSAYLSNGRILPVRLRQEKSFGLVVPLQDNTWQVGDKVTEYFPEATKYEPPVRDTSAGSLPDHPLFPRYTDIENLRHYPEKLNEGETIGVTEKLHGENRRVGFVREGNSVTLMVGSHNLRRQIPMEEDGTLNVDAAKRDDYSFPLADQTVIDFLTKMAEDEGINQLVLFGEAYGKFQSMNYGLPGGKGFRVFDIMINGSYVDFNSFMELTTDHNIERVPVLYVGPYSLETVRSLSEGKTLLGAEHHREGVVVRPVEERHDSEIGRVILKYLSDTYLLSKHSDYTDV